MSRTFGSLLAGAALVTLGALTANATPGPNDPNALTPRVTTSKAAGSGSARLTALVSPFATGFLVRGKGVAFVTHPATGEWCIQAKAGLNVNTIVPSVSVDFSTSAFGNDHFVQYRSGGNGCPAGSIDVLTFELTGGTLVQADTVAFTLVVP